jgi:hypothetical protein
LAMCELTFFAVFQFVRFDGGVIGADAIAEWG